MKFPLSLRVDRDGLRRVKSLVISALALGCVAVALVPLGSILYEATIRGFAALGPSLFTDLPPPPCNPDAGPCPTGGIANAFQGTLLLVALAALVALPVGVLTGIYVSEFGTNRIGRTVRFFTDIMTEIPSIVVGIFVYGLLLELAMLNAVDRRLVFSTTAGVLALSTIMVPIVARTSEEALKLVPVATREAALALGIPKYRVVLRVVLSSGRGGLLTGALLAVARVSGETAPLIMTAFGNSFFFQGLDQPVEAMPLLIFKFGISPFGNWQTLAWGAALLLVVMMLSISVVARFALRSRFGLAGSRT